MSPWRVVKDGTIRLGHCDHQQQFGQSEPLDAQLLASELAGGRVVAEARALQGTGDLVVEFDGDVRLEVFNNSSGYEGWTASAPDGRVLIACGGGELTEWDADLHER